ncbi:nucleotidyltransferase family protein [Sporolactobacillus shoreae]|uniref:nucleotidyltransferase family protein n=1 Tax=Sporolactobacillus shoreae TaxID=1465501 RepID=UPI0019D56E0A|nr:nucleotidyltransferase family protein [Sporolactobacillus shoreae]
MKKLDKFLLSEQTTIIDALVHINNNATGTAIIVDENDKLLGTLTDGDIRRALIQSVPLNGIIKNIYRSNCIFFYDGYDEERVKEVFNTYIKIIPVIDHNRTVIDVVTDKDFSVQNHPRTNAVLIMAGGLGTRLRPLTQEIPKPMLKVGEKPILQLIIERFRDLGFKNILLSVNYKADIIENYFMDGSAFGVTIKYIKETKRMGTAGAIGLAEKYLKEPFIVMNGDILTNLDFNRLLDYHKNNDFSMTIGSRSFEMQVPYGVLNVDNEKIISLEEKPTERYVVSGGIYVLNPNVIEHIPDNEFYDIPQLIDGLISSHNKVGNFPILDYWMDIGKMGDYHQANEDMKEQFEGLNYV